MPLAFGREIHRRGDRAQPAHKHLNILRKDVHIRKAVHNQEIHRAFRLRVGLKVCLRMTGHPFVLQVPREQPPPCAGRLARHNLVPHRRGQHDRRREHMRILETEARRAEAAHGNAADDAPFLRAHAMISRFDEGNQVVHHRAFHLHCRSVEIEGVEAIHKRHDALRQPALSNQIIDHIGRRELLKKVVAIAVRTVEQIDDRILLRMILLVVARRQIDGIVPVKLQFL